MERADWDTYKVSPVGQLCFPASARRAWRLHDGGNIAIADLGQMVLATRSAAEYALIEAIYPQSNLTERGINLTSRMSTPGFTANTERIPQPSRRASKAFETHKLSRGGQFTLPREVRNRWNIQNGGRVQANDLDTIVLIKPCGVSINPAEVAPIGLLKNPWQQNVLSELSSRVQELGYHGWCAELGQQLLHFALTGEGTYRHIDLTPAANTLLGQKIGRSVIQHAMEIALSDSSD